MRVNANRPSPLGEQFWSSRDIRQPHNVPLWMRAIYSKQEIVYNSNAAWVLQGRLRPRGWHQTGYDTETGSLY